MVYSKKGGHLFCFSDYVLTDNNAYSFCFLSNFLGITSGVGSLVLGMDYLTGFKKKKKKETPIYGTTAGAHNHFYYKLKDPKRDTKHTGKLLLFV